MSRGVIDVSHLPKYAFHHRSLVFWGTTGLIAIEGMMFALFIVSYLYLKGREPHWPPARFSPDLMWGTINTVIILASALPNLIYKRAAERLDMYALRRWLTVAILFAVAFNVVRVFEFRHLNVWWDSNAYGSIVWTILGFHTFHLVTDLIDSVALLALLYIGPMQESHFVDAADNALYYYFVVISWIPIYVVLYLVPRWT